MADRDELIMKAFTDLRKDLTENHIDVVQRLTRVETQITPLAPLTERVEKLEGWRNLAAGGFVVLGFAIKSALALITRGK